MQNFPTNFHALVIGASGGIGAAFLQILKDHPQCGHVIGLHRKSQPAIDFENEASIAAAAEELRPFAPFHLIINAAGILHTDEWMPEKKLADLQFAQLQKTFQINTFGPALVLRYFSPLLDKDRGVLAMLSAKVGSIGDNQLGGWYSYRASKAALNMLVKTASIELKRSHPNALCVAVHPNTVNTPLSKPFRGEQIGRPALSAAQDMLTLLDSLTASDSGEFYAYDGEHLPW
jgi:NAD(P)-dependent dehydrogenase (short-subunit alcohol dehydrogenase family)